MASAVNSNMKSKGHRGNTKQQEMEKTGNVKVQETVKEAEVEWMEMVKQQETDRTGNTRLSSAFPHQTK